MAPTNSPQRITTLQGHLKEQGWGGALLFHSRDVFYYTGTAQPAYLFVFPDDYHLFIRSGLDFALEEAFVDTDRIKGERRLDAVSQMVSTRLRNKTLGTELDLLTVNQHRRFQKIFKGFDFIDASPLVLAQRKKKDSSEIALIRESCRAVDAGHRALLETLEEGKSELELAAVIENAHRLAGHEGIFFMRKPDFLMGRGPIASGPNLFRFSGVLLSISGCGLSPSVPAGPSRRKVSWGDLIVVDIPTQVKGYHADQTRVYSLGKVSREVSDLHHAAKDIADYVIEKTRPGMHCGDVFGMAEERARAIHMEDAFLNFGNGRRSHMIGHGIGLECTEPPVLSKQDQSKLEQDYVMALEIHMMREGVGVLKLEDMIHIGKEKNEILTISPRTLFEVY
jgi:Xaa-Pro aminopeptidase